MSTAQMLEVAPYLVVADLAAAITHYEARLGFGLTEVEGDPATVAVLSRDGIALMLRTGDPAVRGAEDPDRRADAYIWVTDVVALADELVARGAAVVALPVDRPVGDGRELQVRDLDGNVLCFGQLLD
ncbi:VOC family protein [Actinomarinicola tropica]|uniref:VOC domain-containing protein n=1 Tax=Actinomarinicola tropica TaxID=2789776 RepID=A0A5Q2RFR8_9ACTN|nr:VOC family protein [Actinomarinicola tropica]QGG94494.1 hypothetical protein GH723_04905 [Actinomarinicola tropica]